MSRNYGPMLEAAQELQFFTGYLDTQGRKEQSKAQGALDAERRKFVYERLKESDDHEALIASVSADLDRIAATTTEYTPGAVEEVRTQLVEHIGKQGANGPVMRFIVRWGPPALTAAAGIGYIGLRLWQ
jgi:hypothetical protein